MYYHRSDLTRGVSNIKLLAKSMMKLLFVLCHDNEYRRDYWVGDVTFKPTTLIHTPKR